MKDPIKEKARRRAYYLAHRDREIAQAMAYKRANRARACATEKAHMARVNQDPEWLKAYQQTRRAGAQRRHAAAPNKWRDYSREYRRLNPEKARASVHGWRLRNLEKAKAIASRWKKENPGRANELYARRRQAVKLATPPWLTQQQRAEIRDVYILAKKMEAATGVPHAVDHIYPLRGKKMCGLHVPWNLQVLTRSENCRKSNLEPVWRPA